MATLLIQQLEYAAQIVLAPPNVVTPDQRQSAENVILNFRKSHLPYNTCKYILENSKTDYVLFQAATTIKENIVREWTLLEQEDIESLRKFLLRYITQNITLQSYVREQILQTVAVILKRGSIDAKSASHDSLFEDISQLVGSGNVTMQLVACSMLMALLQEYSSTSGTSSVGLTWEFHINSKKKFEQSDLKRVFVFAMKVIHELEQQPSPLSRENTAVFNRFLTILEQVLSWEFTPKMPHRYRVGIFDNSQNVVLRAPESWRDTLLDDDCLQLLYRVHQKIRHNTEMANHSMQCLSQLASLSGAIFADDAARTAYLTAFLKGLLHMLNSIDLQEQEYLGVANIVNNLLMFSPGHCWSSIDKAIYEAFINHMTKLTCKLCHAASQEEASHSDDLIHMDAYERMLESWIEVVTDMNDLHTDLLHTPAMEVFNSYLMCHISAPEGVRNQLVKRGDDSDVEIGDIEEDDRDRFRDQLMSIGLLARLVPDHSIPLLSKLLEDRVNRLHGQLQRLEQQLAEAGGNINDVSNDNTLCNSLNEDIHWLILVTGHVLSDDAEGETPLIPSAIMNYSIAQAPKVDITTTLKVLGSPGESFDSIPGSEESTDNVVRLISAVLRVCEMEKRAVAAKLSDHLSPQVASTTVWFLHQWSRSYLLPDENYYKQISVSISSAFGRDTDGGQWMISFLLEKIFSNIVVWGSEEKLLTDTMDFLVTLVENRARCSVAVKCQTLWNIAKQEASHNTVLNDLPATCKRRLLKGLVLAGCGTMEASLKAEYWKVVLQSVQDRFVQLVTQENFTKEGHLPELKSKTLSILESLCGIAEACRIDNVNLLFHFLHPLMTECVKLLDVYHNYEDIVSLILELFTEVVQKQLCYLSQTDSQQLYQSCLSIIESYSKHNIGKKYLVNSAEAEEDKFNDILLLMDLLTNLLSKDFIDFGQDDITVHGGQEVAVSDVVLYGLNIIIPLMNADLLKFPSLCHQYFRLVCFLAEVHPDKFPMLPEDLFKNLMASVELGLNAFGTEVTKMTLEILTSLATYTFDSGQTETAIKSSMAHFLTLIFNLLLLNYFDMELMDIASTCFFLLICCHQAEYRLLVNQLLEQQDPAFKQRLADAFNKLTPPSLYLSTTRHSKLTFNQNFNEFLINVRGFLCVR